MRSGKPSRFATALLDSDWTRGGIEQVLTSVCNRRVLGRQPWAQRLVKRFPTPPSRQALLAYLSAELPQLLRGVSDSRMELLHRRGRLKPSTMRQAIESAGQWDLPRLSNPSELAECLEVPPLDLPWLANHRVAHYSVRGFRKRTAGTRIVEAPKPRLKSVQRAIVAKLLRQIPAHPAAHGFVPRRSAISCVAPHVGQPIIVRMDLKDFFPRIAGQRVFGLMRSLGYPYQVADLLTRLCTTVTGLHDLEAIASGASWGAAGARQCLCDLRQVYFRQHLPQGAPTSPSLANLIAYRLDCRLAGLARCAGIRYTRYADDLIFSGPKEFDRQARTWSLHVGAICLEEGHEVQYRKLRIMRPSTRQLALGIVLNQRTNAPREVFDRLKAILHNCRRHGPESQNRDGHPHFRQHLLGRIQWVKQLNPGRGAKLESLFAEIAWPPSS